MLKTSLAVETTVASGEMRASAAQRRSSMHIARAILSSAEIVSIASL